MGMGLNQLPRIIPNPYDNTLLIQSTPEQWAQIDKLLAQLAGEVLSLLPASQSQSLQSAEV